MSIVAPSGLKVTGGVDTHGDVHVAAVLDSTTTKLLGTASFPTTLVGYEQLRCWMQSYGQLERVGAESTGSYGAGLARYLHQVGIEVIEVDQPDRKQRRLAGKSDPTDAQAAGRAVLSGRATTVPKTVEYVRCRHHLPRPFVIAFLAAEIAEPTMALHNSCSPHALSPANS